MSKLRIGQARCPYCGYLTTTGGISTHVKHCSKNPDVLTKKRQKVEPTEVPFDSLPKHLQEIIASSGEEVQQESYYYPLFKFFNEEHNLVLLESEIQEIIHQVNKFNYKP